jgi:diacylglycerol kinase
MLDSFRFAFKGIKEAFHTQWNFKIHLICTVLIFSAGFIFHISVGEWTAVILCIGMVLTLELMNTAIEYLVNLVSPDYNIQAGKVKDIAAGAVLIGAVTSIIVAAVIFIPKIFLFIRN